MEAEKKALVTSAIVVDSDKTKSTEQSVTTIGSGTALQTDRAVNGKHFVDGGLSKCDEALQIVFVL